MTLARITYAVSVTINTPFFIWTLARITSSVSILAICICSTIVLKSRTNPVILLNEPQSSKGALFSALLLVRTDRNFKFKIRIMSQNLTYATHLSSCHRCTEITEEIHCWIIGGRGSESAQLESFPLTCYIPGRLPCSTLCRLGSVKYLINVDCQEATGNSTKTNTT